MAIVTTTVSVDYNYLRHKSKDRLLSLYEQLTGVQLSGDEYRALKAKPAEELRRMVWKVWSALPE